MIQCEQGYDYHGIKVNGFEGECEGDFSGVAEQKFRRLPNQAASH